MGGKSVRTIAGVEDVEFVDETAPPEGIVVNLKPDRSCCDAWAGEGSQRVKVEVVENR